MKRLLFCLALIGIYIGCSPAQEEPKGEVSSAYMFSIEPCETSSQFGERIVKWVTIGSGATVTKVRVSYWPSDPVDPNFTRLLTAQDIPSSGTTPNTACWDRFPSQIPESYVSDSLNPPGTSGYYVGAYAQNKFVDVYGYAGAVNNDPWNPSPWVRVIIATSSWGSWVNHRWILYGTNPYTWTQEY